MKSHWRFSYRRFDRKRDSIDKESEGCNHKEEKKGENNNQSPVILAKALGYVEAVMRVRASGVRVPSRRSDKRKRRKELGFIQTKGQSRFSPCESLDGAGGRESEGR